MGKTSDITSISNSIGTTILHGLLVEYTNRKESITHLSKESVEYRGQSIKKINRVKLSERDKQIIKNKVIRKINNRLKSKYPDVKISQKEIRRRVDEELFYFFG